MKVEESRPEVRGPARSDRRPRVVVVAEHASARFGGEAVLPLHYFRLLRRRGIDAWLVVHARTRDELLELLPTERDRIFFIPDTELHKTLGRACRWLPAKAGGYTLGYLIRLDGQFQARRIVRRLIAEHGADVVHQPIPVSPREPSVLHGLGVPVVIGPMNGGMSFPPAFRRREGRFDATFVRLLRGASTLLHRLLPGKLRAEVLLVANERTRRALPGGTRGRTLTLVENGVDLSVWEPDPEARPDAVPEPGAPVRFAFVGRLVDWKGVDLLLDAFGAVVRQVPAVLEILGDGPMADALKARAGRLGLEGSVQFAGWRTPEECARRLRTADVLVLPSLYECGGAVVLEAMACGLPVIATNWGGPADYLDETCGLLVDPDSREGFIQGLTAAMLKLAESPQLRAALGQAGRERVTREFAWERKIDRILEIYEDAARVAKDYYK